ncbi:Chaperone protein DnaJ [subsurface metagenome]
MGEPGELGGPSGDLYIVLYVKPHKIFKRTDVDISCTHSISFVKAALGGTTTVPTLEEKAKLKIPAGTQPNSVFRLRGKGIFKIGTQQRGNQYIKVKVDIPKRINDEQRNLLLEYAKLSGEDIEKLGEKGIFEKIKNALG